MLRSGITETFDELASMVSAMKLCARKSLNDTTCHRLTAACSLGVLRCGDPGGPGSASANESAFRASAALAEMAPTAGP
jgi:hypothetical protein